MSKSQPERKRELPLSSDAEIADVVRQFEAHTLPYANWTHRAHLAVAVMYSRNFPFDAALSRMRDNINSYNRVCGDPSGYNETVTILFLRKIYAEMQERSNCQSLYEEVERLAKLCTVQWLYTYYTRDVIWSESAKTSWIAPNITELDF